jgi:HPt (histidine-containing phosphotransfer) domain-containing protein
MRGAVALDAKKLAGLRELGGEEFAQEMVRLFFQYIPGKLAEAREAGRRGDLAGVQNAAHPIKSSATKVGAVALGRLAARIERLAAERKVGAIRLLGELEAAYEQVCPLLRQQLKG